MFRKNKSLILVVIIYVYFIIVGRGWSGEVLLQISLGSMDPETKTLKVCDLFVYFFADKLFVLSVE